MVPEEARETSKEEGSHQTFSPKTYKPHQGPAWNNNSKGAVVVPW